MTDAKNFGTGKNLISFKIGCNAMRVTHVRITLNSMDTYDMVFFNIRGAKITEVSRAEGVYCDMLRSMFTEHTGIETSL